MYWLIFDISLINEIIYIYYSIIEDIIIGLVNLTVIYKILIPLLGIIQGVSTKKYIEKFL